MSLLVVDLRDTAVTRLNITAGFIDGWDVICKVRGSKGTRLWAG